MKPEEVASYLKQHPEFFEDHADFVSTVFIPHPHGGRAISISERQISNWNAAVIDHLVADNICLRHVCFLTWWWWRG